VVGEAALAPSVEPVGTRAAGQTEALPDGVVLVVSFEHVGTLEPLGGPNEGAAAESGEPDDVKTRRDTAAHRAPDFAM